MFTSPEFRRLTLLTLLGLSVTVPTAASAGVRSDAAQTCAEALAARQGQSSYELAHRVQRPGYGNYQLWLNGNETGASGFCEVRRGELARVVERTAPWQRREAEVPAPAMLGALD
jgi:hypothetical protein